MNELEKYRERRDGPVQDTYFYALADPRPKEEINRRFASHPDRWTTVNAAQIGFVAAFDKNKTRLLKALYKRMEFLRRELQICSCSTSNQWLRNLMDFNHAPIVKLLFYAPAFPVHAIKDTCKRLGEGAVYDANVLQAIAQETKDEQIPEAQAYVNQFFSGWFAYRESNPQAREFVMPGVEGYAQIRSVAPAQRLTAKTLQIEIDKLKSDLETLKNEMALLRAH